jgi:hypothetical protein
LDDPTADEQRRTGRTRMALAGAESPDPEEYVLPARPVLLGVNWSGIRAFDTVRRQAGCFEPGCHGARDGPRPKGRVRRVAGRRGLGPPGCVTRVREKNLSTDARREQGRRPARGPEAPGLRRHIAAARLSERFFRGPIAVVRDVQ